MEPHFDIRRKKRMAYQAMDRSKIEESGAWSISSTGSTVGSVYLPNLEEKNKAKKSGRPEYVPGAMITRRSCYVNDKEVMEQVTENAVSEMA
jgi:hypothetical protein